MIAEVHANLGWIGMTPLKSTPIWDDPRGEGRVWIAGIADIARHRRNRKGKTVPLINTDDTDLKADIGTWLKSTPKWNALGWGDVSALES